VHQPIITPAALEQGVRIGRASRLEWYCLELSRQVLRRLTKRADADDVAQRVVERLLQDPERLMAEYPSPAQYAAAATAHTAIGEDRRNRGQRCEGTRLRVLDDRTVQARRQWISGDALGPDGEPGAFERHADDSELLDERVARQLDASLLAGHAVAGLSDDDRRALHLVHVLGHTVKEVAELMGVRRETMSRRMGRILHTVHQNLAMAPRTTATDA